MLSSVFDKLTPLLDAFLPGEVRRSPSKRHRHRFAVLVIAITTLYLLLVGLVVARVAPDGVPAAALLGNFRLLVVAGAAFALFVLRRYQQRVIALNLYMAALGFGFIYVIANSGGMASPVNVCALALPLIATLGINALAGVIWTGIVAAAWFSINALADGGVEWQNLLNESTVHNAKLLALFSTLGLISMAAVYFDISSRQLKNRYRHEHGLALHMANHDALTNLANRRHFIRELERHINASTQPLCLIYVDLNYFKQANDQFGHHVGDEILRQFAQRLKNSVRNDDLVARMGGDEFCILIQGISDDSGARQKMAQIKEKIGGEMHIEDFHRAPSASLGYALYPKHGRDYEVLLQHADHSMYEAKRDRRGTAPNSPLNPNTDDAPTRH